MSVLSPENLPAAPGTYVLVIALPADLTVQVGRLGIFTLSGGLYAYVGSAQGPGGLRARAGRHLRATKTPHWHIDALTNQESPCAVWFTASDRRLECAWAQTIRQSPGVTIPIAGFGASDCRCTSHLFTIPPEILCEVWVALDQPDSLTLGGNPEFNREP